MAALASLAMALSIAAAGAESCAFVCPSDCGCFFSDCFLVGVSDIAVDVACPSSCQWCADHCHALYCDTALDAGIGPHFVVSDLSGAGANSTLRSSLSETVLDRGSVINKPLQFDVKHGQFLLGAHWQQPFLLGALVGVAGGGMAMAAALRRGGRGAIIEQLTCPLSLS
mmetsp:Transcript_31207/g.72432  ORF Transcript_31207/g.72432 Transcript_31207/m.72432 type:complete len:169 (-) Transcript_31207:65-571(-)